MSGATMILTPSDWIEPVEVPCRYVVCPRCDGAGKHDHPAFSNGITGSEWNEWDPEEREHYLRGAYDVRCEECKGERVVAVPDVAAMTYAQKRAAAACRRDEREDARYAAERAHELRMGY